MTKGVPPVISMVRNFYLMKVRTRRHPQRSRCLNQCQALHPLASAADWQIGGADLVVASQLTRGINTAPHEGH
jgi:hypothetical protein